MTECEKAFEEWLKGEGKFESSIPDEAKRAGYIACWKNHVEPRIAQVKHFAGLVECVGRPNPFAENNDLRKQNKLLLECVEWYSKLGRGEVAKACLKKVGCK